MDSPESASGNPYPTGSTVSITPPELNAAGTELKLEAKAVKDAFAAANICRGLEQNNRQRALRASDLQSLHDGKPPGSQTDALEKGQNWRARVSTLWLAGIVGRVAQRFVNAIISQIYCTASSLPDNYEKAKTKTDSLRAGFTSLVRGWDGNTGQINAVAMETVLQGYSYCVFLDPHTWIPSFFKQDELFVPEKATQHARDLQYFAARRDFRLDVFISLFKDEKAAADVGYDLKNCLEAASKARPQDQREDAATTQFRNFVDMINEGAIGLGMSATGEVVVKTWMLFYREYDGSVSFWLLERDTGKKLRFSFKLFKRMQDVITMFSFEAGNGCIHSSKGLGRKLAALATMKELFRCGIIDNGRMGGMILVGVDAAQKANFAPVMMAPFILVDKSVVDLKNVVQLQVSAEAYQIIDTLFDSWAEQAVGAYLAAQINDKGKTERTATEASIDSRRENEAADIMIRRCLDQDATLRQMQQIRACSTENIKEARRLYEKSISQTESKPEDIYPDDIDDANLMRFLVKKMEEGMTDEEIQTWSKSPASAFAHVTEAAVQQGLAILREKLGGSQNIDWALADYAILEGLVGAEYAKLLYIPKANETAKIEAERKQQMETLAMTQSGLPIQVSPRDNHMLEIPVVIALLNNVVKPAMQNGNANDTLLKTAELNLNHMAAHLEAVSQTPENKLPAFKAFEQFYEGFKKDLGLVIQVKQQTQVAHDIVVQKMRMENGTNGAANGAPPPNIPGDFQPAAVEATPRRLPSLAA